MASEASLHVLAPVYGQPHFEGEAEPPYKRARPDEEALDPTLTCEGGSLDKLSEESHDKSAASSTAAPGETMLLPAEGLAFAPSQAAHEEAAPAEAHEEGAQLMGHEKGAEAAHPDEQSTPPPASTIVPEPALLPVTSIRHIMKRAMGGEQDAITDPSVSVVQRCTTEFVSLVVSEARVRVAKEGRTSVTYSDIVTALNALGFKQFQEPLKAHMTLHYGGSAITQRTLGGGMLVRKCFDEAPAFSVDHSFGDGGQTHFCRLEGCDKAFADAASLRRHMHTHGDKQTICQDCGKLFLDSSKLKRHMLTHTGERPYGCPIEGCGKRFSLDFNLRSHMRTHTGERPHVCSFPGCDKRFAQESNLKTHLKSHLNNTVGVDAAGAYEQGQAWPSWG